MTPRRNLRLEAAEPYRSIIRPCVKSEIKMMPTPLLQLEAVLAFFRAARPCDGCGKPLGNAPRQISRGRHYHPACAPKEG